MIATIMNKLRSNKKDLASFNIKLNPLNKLFVDFLWSVQFKVELFLQGFETWDNHYSQDG